MAMARRGDTLRYIEMRRYAAHNVPCVRVCVRRPVVLSPFVFATNKTINKTQTSAQAQNVFMSNCHAGHEETPS